VADYLDKLFTDGIPPRPPKRSDRDGLSGKTERLLVVGHKMTATELTERYGGAQEIPDTPFQDDPDDPTLRYADGTICEDFRNPRMTPKRK
jgi:hypothetical protein